MIHHRSCMWLAVFLVFQMGFNSSCSTDPVRLEDPRDAYYSISCILLSSSTLHNVVIGKAWPEELPAKVPDARVFIQGNGKRTSFSYTGVMGTYENTSHPLQVHPTTDYYLEVQIPNERDFFGHIVTPGAVEFLNIADQDTLDYHLSARPDTVDFKRICWTNSIGAYYYRVYLDCKDRFFVYEVSCYKTSTFIPERRVNDWTDHDFPQSGEIIPATLTVAALDSTFDFPGSFRYFYNYPTDVSSDHQSFSPQSNTELHAQNVNSDTGAFSAVMISSIDIWLRIYRDEI